MKIATMLAVLVVAGSAWGQDGDARRAALDKLATQRITVDFRETPLADAIDYLRDATGLNFHLDPAVSGSDARVTLKVKDLPVRSVLKLALAARGLQCGWKDGVLLVGPKTAAAMSTRIYDVRDLAVNLQDFPGPSMDLKKDAPGPIVDWMPEPKPRMSEDFLVEMVRAGSGAAAWEEAGASMNPAGGLLVVTQTEAAHREIASLLNRLRGIR